MTKISKYMLAKSESDISNIFSVDRTPLIKVKENKIIEPKEIDLGNLSLIEWLKANENELTYISRPLFSKESPIVKSFYNSEWNLYELLLDFKEDFEILENIDAEKSQFKNDIRQFNILQKNLENVFDFIEPTYSNKQVYGLQLRNIILLASMEVEVHWQKLLKNNGYNKNRLTTKDYIKLCEFINFKFEFKLTSFPEFGIIYPFNNWETELPTKSLKWYDAYNKIKHDRSSNLELATLELAITSVSAVLSLLNIRYGKINVEKEINNNLFSNVNHIFVSKHFHSSMNLKYRNDITYKKYFNRE